MLALLPPEEGMKLLAGQAFQPAKDNRTADEQNYEYAKSQGYKGSFLEFQTELKKSGRQQTIVNMPGPATPDERGRGAFAEANAKAQAQYFDDVAKAGAQANQRLGDINQLTSLIELTPQGAGQDWINKGAAILSRFGINPGEFTNVPAAQAFQSIVSRVAPTLRVTGSGATSDFEMNQFLASLPAIGNMPDGNRIIANNLKKISERSVQEAYIANQVQGGDLTPTQGRKKILDLGPLDLDMPTFGSAPPAGGPGRAPSAPGGVGAPAVRYEDQLPEGFE
jgi:flagellar protein FlgJ